MPQNPGPPSEDLTPPLPTLIPLSPLALRVLRLNAEADNMTCPPQTLKPTHPSTPQVFDFKSEADINTYLTCETAQPGKAVLKATTTQIGKAKAIIPITACIPKSGSYSMLKPGTVAAYAHVYLINVTTKAHDPAAIKAVVKSVKETFTPISCLWTSYEAGADMGWGAYLSNSTVSPALCMCAAAACIMRVC